MKTFVAVLFLAAPAAAMRLAKSAQDINERIMSPAAANAIRPIAGDDILPNAAGRNLKEADLVISHDNVAGADMSIDDIVGEADLNRDGRLQGADMSIDDILQGADMSIDDIVGEADLNGDGRLEADGKSFGQKYGAIWPDESDDMFPEGVSGFNAIWPDESDDMFPEGVSGTHDDMMPGRATDDSYYPDDGTEPGCAGPMCRRWYLPPGCC